jgi:transcription antitermination factor NusG
MQTAELDIQGASSPQEWRWCAVHTRHQHENRVNWLLRTKGFETFFPTLLSTHEWKDRKKKISEALFPGYLFVANIGPQGLQIISTPGVCAIVSVAGTPAIIPNQEIEAIRRAIESPYNVQPHAYLSEGACVRVRRGPLAGVKGILVRKGHSTRLVLSVELLGRAAAVEIDGNCVEPAGQTLQFGLPEGAVSVE